MTDKAPSGDESGLSLDPSADEVRRWGNGAIETMADYPDSIRDRRVYQRTTARQIWEELDRTLPEEGVAFDGLLEISADASCLLTRGFRAIVIGGCETGLSSYLS